MATAQETAPIPLVVLSPAPSNSQIPSRLVARISNQSGSETLNLSQCNLGEIVELKWIEVIRNNYIGNPLDLDISYNAISSISPEFTLTFMYLKKLDISGNYLPTLPENFGLLRDLEYLDLRNNLLETLPLSMGRMSSLRFLDISGNPLRSPLKDMLERGAKEIPDVLKFLDQLNTSLCSAEVRPNRPSDKLRPIQRTTLAIVGDVQLKNKITVGKVLVKAMPWILMISILAGYFVETAYLDWLSEQYPSVKWIWIGYKPVHEAAVTITQWIPKSDSYVLKPPPPRALGFLSQIWSSIWT